MWTLIACLITALVLVTMTLSVYSVARLTRGRLASAGRRPVRRDGISILKPLCGADDALEDNLAGFFVQEAARYELVFGVEGDTDPAIAVVRRLRERFPLIPVRLVIHDGGAGAQSKGLESSGDVRRRRVRPGRRERLQCGSSRRLARPHDDRL